MKRVLIYIDEAAVPDSVDLLEAARRMYGSGRFQSYALALGGDCGDAVGLFDVVVQPRAGTVPDYDAAAIAYYADSLHRRFGFDAVLVPATPFGRTVAPRTAIRLGAGLVADVTEVRSQGDEVLMVRPAFSGRMLATVTCRGDGPVMMSVRPRTFFYREREARTTELIALDLDYPGDSGIRLLDRRDRNGGKDIRDSAVLVAGGGGALRDFSQLEQLARALRGMVAASRKAVDHGAAPRSVQVGQSGKNVGPRLYFAVGISGSSQHAAGLKNADCIIAVNTDRQAPICSMADLVVEGDSRSFLTGLLTRLDAHKQDNQGG